jgi:hypothetical protein
VKLVRGDAPLGRAVAVSLAVLIPLGLWWLHAHPGALNSAAGPCRFEQLVGLPCPTCGATGALLALARGDLGEALARHPLVTLAVVGLAVWSAWGLAATIVPRWRRRLELDPGDGRRVVWSVLGLVAASWAWTIAAPR